MIDSPEKCIIGLQFKHHERLSMDIHYAIISTSNLEVVRVQVLFLKCSSKGKLFENNMD